MDDPVPGLLFADDTALVSDDEGGMVASLDCLVRGYRKWGVTVNVEKSGITHMSGKGVDGRATDSEMDGRVIPMVGEYKHSVISVSMV